MSESVRESALTFVVEHPGPSSLSYCRQENRERGLVPHLTVLCPWRPAPLRPADLAAAAQVVRGFGPITLRFDHLDTFRGGVVYAAPADASAVVGLTELGVLQQDAEARWAVTGAVDLR